MRVAANESAGRKAAAVRIAFGFHEENAPRCRCCFSCELETVLTSENSRRRSCIIESGCLLRPLFIHATPMSCLSMPRLRSFVTRIIYGINLRFMSFLQMLYACPQPKIHGMPCRYETDRMDWFHFTRMKTCALPKQRERRSHEVTQSVSRQHHHSSQECFVFLQCLVH